MVSRVAKRGVGTRLLKPKTQRKTKTNVAIDKRLNAKRSGKRKTRNPHTHHGRVVRKSTTYTETRRNRSDKKGSRV